MDVWFNSPIQFHSKYSLEKEEPDFKSDVSKESSVMEVAGPLLSYLAEMVLALKFVLEQDSPVAPSASTTQPSNDIVVQDLETDWIDDVAEDEESGGEESVSTTQFTWGSLFCNVMVLFPG